MNINKLKKMYDNNLLNQTIVFAECKPFIIEHLQKGYSYEKTIQALKFELKEIGIDTNITYQGFFMWKDRINKFTGEKNLDIKAIKDEIPTKARECAKPEMSINTTSKN